MLPMVTDTFIQCKKVLNRYHHHSTSSSGSINKMQAPRPTTYAAWTICQCGPSYWVCKSLDVSVQ